MKTKFAIGCFVIWYEIEIVTEYLKSVKYALEEIENPENVTVDIGLSTNQELEQIDDSYSMEDIKDKFYKAIKELFQHKKYDLRIKTHPELYTIANYRRDFNDRYCDEVDILIWGESDALMPRQTFQALDILHQNVKDSTPRYLATFGICKMWDEGWKCIEHNDFTDKPFIEGDSTNWWSLRYTMNQKEMDDINEKADELDVRIVSPHKFNGCGLIISSEVIKAGVNIPRCMMLVHEDSAFMFMTNKVLGTIPQYIFKNLLQVHNRKSSLKRLYTKNEPGDNVSEMRKSNNIYNRVWKMDHQNLHNLFDPNYKSFNWKNALE